MNPLLPALCATLAGLLLVLVVLAWRANGAIRIARWRALRRHLKAARPAGPRPPSGEPPASQAGPDGGARGMPFVPPRSAGDAGLPRMLMIGDGAAGLSALLSTAFDHAPPQPLAADGAQSFWRWWTLPSMVVIEVRPPPADPGPQDTPDLLWYSALQGLVRSNPRRPLDGLVVCVSTTLLRADPTVADCVMQLAARRIHQTASALCMRLPVQVLVTGLQDLPGYDCVRAALPEALAAQALGWRPPGGRAAPSPLPAMAQPIRDALQALRLGLLASPREARARHDIHRFVETVLALQPGLERLHAALKLDGGPRTPCQGLYLTASGPDPAFIRDVLLHFLPAASAVAADMR